MNVNEMSQEEKSVALAKLCGWEYSDDMRYLSGVYEYGVIWFDRTDDSPNLYDPANMALAWRVLNWASYNLNKITDDFSEGVLFDFMISGVVTNGYYDAVWTAPPDEAQSAWLDKILELAVEAGMVPA